MARKKDICARKSHRMATAAYTQNQCTAGITVMDPNAKARKLVAEVMATLTPARSAANSARERTSPPSLSVTRANRKLSRRTMTSSTPTPRKMNGPTCARLVNGTPAHITAPYPANTDRPTAHIPHAVSVANDTCGARRNRCVSITTAPMTTNAATTSGMSPVTLRLISLSNART